MKKLSELKESYANIEYLKAKPRTSSKFLALKNQIIKSRNEAKDPDLTLAAQHKQAEAMKTAAIKEFLADAADEQRFHNTTIAEIKDGARAIVTQELPPASVEAQRLFERQLMDLKVDVAVGRNPQQAVTALVNHVKEPALAAQLASELPALITQAMSRATGPQINEWQQAFSVAYEDVKQKSYTEEMHEASELYDAVTASENHSLYGNLYHADFIEGTLGAQWVEAFKDPTTYDPKDATEPELGARARRLAEAKEEVKRNPTDQNMGAFIRLQHELNAEAEAEQAAVE